MTSIINIGDDCWVHILSFLLAEERINFGYLSKWAHHVSSQPQAWSAVGFRNPLRVNDDVVYHLYSNSSHNHRQTGYMDLSHARIRDYSLSFLSNLPLTSLSLRGCDGISDEGLSFLTRLPLVHLDLNHCSKITDNGCSSIRDMPFLRWLSLGDCARITGVGIYHVSCVSLSYLNVQGCRLINDAAITLIRDPVLKSLNVGDTAITDAALNHLAGLRLTSLQLPFCGGVTDNGVAMLTRHRTLSQLDLAYCTRITDEGLLYVGQLYMLTDLDIIACNITDQGLYHLRNLPLKKLSISQCSVTDTGLTHLLHMPLNELNLKRCDRITQEGVRPLITTLPSLRYLDISYCRRIRSAATLYEAAPHTHLVHHIQYTVM